MTCLRGQYAHAQGVPQQPSVTSSALGMRSGSGLHLHHFPAQPHDRPAPAAQGSASWPPLHMMGGPAPAQPPSRSAHSRMTLPVGAQQASAAVVTSGDARHTPQQGPRSVAPRPLPTAAVSTAPGGSPQFTARQSMALQMQTFIAEAQRQQAAEQQEQQQQAFRQHAAVQQAAQQQQMAASASQMQARLPGNAVLAMGYPAQPAKGLPGQQQPPAVASQPRACAGPHTRQVAPQLGFPVQQTTATALGQPQPRTMMSSTGVVLAPGNLQAAAQLPHDNQVFMQVANA